MAIESISGKAINPAPPTKSTAKADSGIKSNDNSSIVDDSFSITSGTQELKASLESSASSAVINEDRVAAVSAALQSGSYSIDPERIAKKILQFENQLPDST